MTIVDHSKTMELPKTMDLPRIPGYTLHSVLGEGGFATVYLATQHSLKRQIALKVMDPTLAVDKLKDLELGPHRSDAWHLHHDVPTPGLERPRPLVPLWR